MSPEVLIAFIAACILLGLTPGPNMSLILASTLSSGLRAGLVDAGRHHDRARPAGRRRRRRHELGDGVHVGVVRRDPLDRRALPGLSGRPPAVAAPPARDRGRPAAAPRRRQPLPRGRAGQPVEPQGAAVPRRVPAAVRRSRPRSGVAALGAGRAVRRRARRRRRRLYAGGRPGARHVRSPRPACASSTAPPASSCCSAAWRWRWRAGRDSGSGSGQSDRLGSDPIDVNVRHGIETQQASDTPTAFQ